MAREQKNVMEDAQEGTVFEPVAEPSPPASPVTEINDFNPNARSMEISRLIREARASENTSSLHGEVNRLKTQIRRMKAEGAV